ncbi:hypothetical protein FZ934_02160 [Rhizobium grahamii]|uniref:Adenylate cyclase n=1 Tax=Rhizobium grahamii TaxID=1120045 RepID=A0A5Q0C273_9HYPH|nr:MULTISPECIES: hypothetical protein [Rhizobium]QFY59345.1 hypothetical protein FZ934_02160 [Rhizobium grahamii]QRM48125.1 hypothetical protein F3Y33_01715 [Rhizobium sp. BG6]
MRNAVNVSDGLGPTAEEIGRQLQRILSSEEFLAPKRGRNFLAFVVNETLAGRSEFLKAFTIANVVFGREASFDPQNDPVVRIEAGRIRRALERYYLVAGKDDAIILTVPKGGYVPHFQYAHGGPVELALAHEPQHPPVAEPTPGAPPSAERQRGGSLVALGLAGGLAVALALLFILAAAFPATWAPPARSPAPDAAEPRVIVEFFAESGPDDASSDIARGLRDDIIGQLVQFRDIIVVADPLKNRRSGGAEYALQGNVQLDGSRLRSVARLVRQSDGAVIWANNYDADLHAQNKLVIQSDIARQVASAIAQPYGALFQTETSTIAKPQNGDQDAYACTLAYYSYRQTMNTQSHAAARDCLQQATQRFPDNATSWALLALVYLDEMRFRYKLGMSPFSAQPLELAIGAVNRAASLEPENPRVLQALMLVNFFRGNIDKALEAGTAAYAANPDDVDVAGEYGMRLALSGKWQSGCELLSVALNKSGRPRGYYEAGMALCGLMRNDMATAEEWARRSDLGSNPMHHLVLLAVLGTAGKTADAKLEKDWLERDAPVLMANIRQEISLRLPRQQDQERFFNGLRAAGVNVASTQQ